MKAEEFRHPYLRHPVPAGVAHRGYSALYPENTMAAFAAAVDLGFRWLETDIRATADGIAVAFHDEELQRLTRLPGEVATLEWSELRRAKVNGQEPIPRLAEVLDAWPDIRIDLHLKCDDAIEPLLAEVAAADAWDRVCVGSFSGRSLRRIRSAAGDRLCTSMATYEVVRLRIASFGLPVGGFAAYCAQVPVRRHGLPVVDRTFLREAGRRRLPVYVWTINEEVEMRRLFDLGVAGILSDDAETLRRVLFERGSWPG